MRRRAKVDANQNLIVDALRKAGCSVEPRMARVGEGCPDLLVGLRQKNFLLEVKNGSRKPSARKLNEKQELWRQLWSGHIDIVYSAEDALRVVGLL